MHKYVDRLTDALQTWGTYARHGVCVMPTKCNVQWRAGRLPLQPWNAES